MDWGQVLTIIFGITGFMSIFMFLINKRIDTLENSLNKRLDTLEKRIDRVEQDLRDLRKEMNERFTKLEELLLKALGVESKKEG